MKEVKIQLHMIVLSAALLSVSLLLFYPFLHEFYIYWDNDPEASSALIIPVFSAYMIWIQKPKLKNLQLFKPYDFSFSKSGFLLLIGGLVLFIIGSFTYVILIKAFAFIVIIIASVLFLFGKDLLKPTLAPILFLLFMLPIPAQAYYVVAEPLKYFIADASTAVLLFLNIPLLMDENVIHLPSISLLIHESCSGIQTTISIVAISSAFAYMFLRSNLLRIAFVMIAIPIGILTNVLRVVIIGVLAYLYDGDVAMKFHANAWVIVTPAGIFTIFLIGNLLRCHER